MMTPTPWDQPSSRHPPSEYVNRFNSRDSYIKKDSRETGIQRERVERLTIGSYPQRQYHSRNGSAAGSSGDYHDPQHGRRHDYDVQAMESDLSPRPGVLRNPIPAPLVTIRSEFPTMNRSRQQQSLTCLITVEVPQGNWRPDGQDLRNGPPGQSQPDESYSAPVTTGQDSRSIQQEPEGNLDEVAENLRTRVDNWHGLEFQRYAALFSFSVPR